MVVLSKSLKEGIDVRDMKDGKIAVIVSGEYKDAIVQRYENTLISLGRSCKHSWVNILIADRCEETTMYVRVLQKGEKLTIE
jgi:hypothetical protein